MAEQSIYEVHLHDYNMLHNINSHWNIFCHVLIWENVRIYSPINTHELNHSLPLVSVLMGIIQSQSHGTDIEPALFPYIRMLISRPTRQVASADIYYPLPEATVFNWELCFFHLVHKIGLEEDSSHVLYQARTFFYLCNVCAKHAWALWQPFIAHNKPPHRVKWALKSLLTSWRSCFSVLGLCVLTIMPG